MTKLNVGDAAPDLSLLDASENPVSLSDLLGSAKNGVVVYFYPKAGTPGCTKQACDFRDSLAAWQSAGYTVVGVSPDKPAALARFAAKQELPFPLLSDADHKAMEAWGVWGEKKNYGKIFLGVRRSTFVVSPDGTLSHAAYNVKATGHVERLRKQLGIGQ